MSLGSFTALLSELHRKHIAPLAIAGRSGSGMTHPRTQYLADSNDTAREPLLRDSQMSQPNDPATQSSQEVQSVSKVEGVTAEAPTAPPLSKSDVQSASSASQSSPPPEYGLPVGYQAQYAEGPPQSATQPRAQSMTHAPQQSWRMQNFGTFDEEPAIITCMQCGRTGQTFTYKESGCCVWFSAITCIFLGCWPCAWMPFCMRPCKDTVHCCSSCGAVVGKHPWGR